MIRRHTVSGHQMKLNPPSHTLNYLIWFILNFIWWAFDETDPSPQPQRRLSHKRQPWGFDLGRSKWLKVNCWNVSRWLVSLRRTRHSFSAGLKIARRVTNTARLACVDALFTLQKSLRWPLGKIIKVESTFHAGRDEHIKTIMLFRKETGELEAGENADNQCYAGSKCEV